MSASTPRVTVVTAVYNGASVIERCIRSVAAQEYPHLEHLIIDGGSTDGTQDVIRCLESQVVKWISERDRGVYDAWNKALSMATGEWIAFLGADDEYLPWAIQKYVDAAHANPAAEFISSQVKFVYPEGRSRIIGSPWNWSSFRTHMCVAHVGSFHRRTLFERLGQFDQTYPIVGDYEFLLRAGPQLKAAFLDAVTAEMAAGGQSDSAAALKEGKLAKRQHRVSSNWNSQWEYLVAMAKFRYGRRVRQMLCQH